MTITNWGLLYTNPNVTLVGRGSFDRTGEAPAPAEPANHRTMHRNGDTDSDRAFGKAKGSAGESSSKGRWDGADNSRF